VVDQPRERISSVSYRSRLSTCLISKSGLLDGNSSYFVVITMANPATGPMVFGGYLASLGLMFSVLQFMEM
jgi:hypothetical protein